MSGVQLITVAEDDGDQRLDRWLRRRFPQVSQGRIEKMCRKGEVRLDGGRVKANTRVQAGQQVRVPPLPDAEALVERWRGPEGDLDIDALGPVAVRYRDLWQHARLERLRDGYDRAIDAKVPGARTLRGHDDLERFWFGYKGAFPMGQFRIHHWIDREDAGEPRRVALRWSLSTTHQGGGVFGPASGAPVVLLGITHAELRGDTVVREWHQLDEIAIHAQIAQHRQQKA